MLKDKALKKILITSITLLILLVLYLIPSIETESTLKANLELEYISGVGTDNIYLLDDNNYLVRSKILITENDLKKKVKALVKNLTLSSSSIFPDSLCAPIPKGTRLLDIEILDKVVTLNFSKEFLKVDKEIEDKMFESIVFSLTDLKKVEGVIIKVEGEQLGNYPNSKALLPKVLTKDIGINKEYNLVKRKDINKVVVYYLENIDHVNYYVPVTRYVNDSRDKVKIIVDNLTTRYIYEPNLISPLKNTTTLKEYNIEENVMFLDFDQNIYSDKQVLKEEVLNLVSYSIFDNYDIESIVLSVEGKNIKQIKRSEL